MRCFPEVYDRLRGSTYDPSMIRGHTPEPIKATSTLRAMASQRPLLRVESRYRWPETIFSSLFRSSSSSTLYLSGTGQRGRSMPYVSRRAQLDVHLWPTQFLRPHSGIAYLSAFCTRAGFLLVNQHRKSTSLWLGILVYHLAPDSETPRLLASFVLPALSWDPSSLLNSTFYPSSVRHGIPGGSLSRDLGRISAETAVTGESVDGLWKVRRAARHRPRPCAPKNRQFLDPYGPSSRRFNESRCSVVQGVSVVEVVRDYCGS